MRKGDRVEIVATGRIKPGRGPFTEYHLRDASATANGFSLGRNNSILPSGPYLSLIARIGRQKRLFFVGEHKCFVATEDGTLDLGINEKIRSSDGKPFGWHNNIYLKTNDGAFDVKIFIYW